MGYLWEVGSLILQGKPDYAEAIDLGSIFLRALVFCSDRPALSLLHNNKKRCTKRVDMADKDMPRKAVIKNLAESHGMSKAEAERVLRTALTAIAGQLALRGRFHIAEIGSVSLAQRPPRRYFNPRTKNEAVSEGDVTLKINISKQMRERVDDE